MEGDGGDKGPMTDITANPDCRMVSLLVVATV